MKSKYVDLVSIIQVLGGIYNNPQLLDNTDKYHLLADDFPEAFHKLLFETIDNLHMLGAKQVTPSAIEDYLEQRPKQLAIFKANKGIEYLQELQEKSLLATFDYYYNRMKKFTLLRMYDNYGIDVKWLYDPDNILDLKKKQEQENWLDNIELQKIADVIDEKIERIRLTYADNGSGESVQAGEGVLELLESLKENPEVGYPLYGAYVNSIFRGARLGKFYLRSAATGVGKTRSMIADACTIACDKRYDSKEGKWIDIGKGQPTNFIATEQDLSEVQTMMIAFLADVNEEHILNGQYYAGEWERVTRAAKILKESPLYVEQLPDFSLQDIENTIKRNIREHGVLYVFLDYIHTSMKILEEITRRSGGVRLREDNILFMMAIRLKDICVQYDVFIMSATQLNGDYTDTDNYDQNLLRGAKSIADKIDAGMIMLEVTANDIESLKTVINSGLPVPTVKISVYKNRRGRWKNVWLWCTEDRGTCKIMPVFVTKMNYELVDIQDTQIKFKGE